MATQRIVFANFNLNKFKDSESYFYNFENTDFNILNNISENLTLTINDIVVPSKLVFSTNGIDGIGLEDETFTLNKNYYQGQKIFFVVKAKTSDNFSVKGLPLLRFYSNTSLYRIGLSCFDDNDQIVKAGFVENFQNSLEDTLGGYFKGYAVIDNEFENLRFKARVETDFGELIGFSPTFKVGNSASVINYRKINEDYDQQETFKSLAFQNILNNKSRFFDDFLGTIVGNISGNPNNLGTKTYEKISNFVSNNSDVDYSNIENLLSMLKNLNIQTEEFLNLFPADLKRLSNNLSINLSKQLGQKNTFNQNFDDKGNPFSKFLGINKGNDLDFNTTVLTAGEGTSYIIAKEIFSNSYKMLNTNILSSSQVRYIDKTTKTYNLSDYKTGWGWGLILPENLGKSNYLKRQENTSGGLEDFIILQDGYYRLRKQDFDPVEGDPKIMQNFYTFSNYISTNDNSYDQKYIDYYNPTNEFPQYVTYNQFASSGGVFENIISNLLTKKTLPLDNDVTEIKTIENLTKFDVRITDTKLVGLERKYNVEVFGGAANRDFNTGTTAPGLSAPSDIVEVEDNAFILTSNNDNPVVTDDGDNIEIF